MAASFINSSKPQGVSVITCTNRPLSLPTNGQQAPKHTKSGVQVLACSLHNGIRRIDKSHSIEWLSFIQSEWFVSFHINTVVQYDIPLFVRRHETGMVIAFEEPWVLVQDPALIGDFSHTCVMGFHTVELPVIPIAV